MFQHQSHIADEIERDDLRTPVRSWLNSDSKRVIRSIAIMAVFALLPILPFIFFGYSGDDFRFHVTSWMSLRDSWLHGNFFPGWDALANYTLGEPRFCIYPPLSFWVGTALSLFLPFRMTPGAFIWLATFVAGSSMYIASASFVREKNRLGAAILYMFNPYLLLTATRRFAMAELLVQASLPLLMIAFYRAVWRGERDYVLWLGALLGFSSCTDVPAAIALAYTLLVAAMIAAVCLDSFVPILNQLSAQIIACALSAFCLAPVLIERKWISASVWSLLPYNNMFIFVPFSRLFDVTLSVSFWVIAIVEFFIIITCALWKRKRDSTDVMFVGLGFTALLFQLPLAGPLWAHLPGLRLVQFPFRFLSILCVVGPFVALSKRANRRTRIPSLILLGAMIALPFGRALRHVSGIVASKYTSFHDFREKVEKGYPGMAEYALPGSVPPRRPLSLSQVTFTGDTSALTCNAVLVSREALRESLAVNARQPCHIRLARYFYPYWQAIDEAGNRLKTNRDQQGMLVVDVPFGRHNVFVVFSASSPLRTASTIVSLITLILLTVTISIASWTERSRNASLEPVVVCS